MEQLFELQAPWWELIFRGVLVYVFVLVLIRLSGKRTVGEFTPFDLIVVILLGETMQGALVPEGDSVVAPMIVAATLVALNWLMAFASTRSRLVDSVVEGHAVVLARDGRVDRKVMRSQNVPHSDLDEAIRKANLDGLQDVKLAMLETNGEITIKPRKKK